MHYFFKNLSSLLPGKDQTTMFIVMMTKEGSTKIINFVTPRAGVLMLGRGHISHYSEYVCISHFNEYVVSSILSIYSTLVAIMMLLSYTIVDFHLFYDGTVDIQI